MSLSVTFRKIKSHLISGSCINDISETGICIPLNIKVSVGTIMELDIRLGDYKNKIKTLAEVVRITERIKDRYRFDVALEFLNLTYEKKIKLGEYLYYNMDVIGSNVPHVEARTTLRDYIQHYMSQAEIDVPKPTS